MARTFKFPASLVLVLHIRGSSIWFLQDMSVVITVQASRFPIVRASLYGIAAPVHTTALISLLITPAGQFVTPALGIYTDSCVYVSLGVFAQRHMHKICIKLPANFLNLPVNILCARIEVAFAGNDTNCLYWTSREPDPGARTRNKRNIWKGLPNPLYMTRGPHPR